MKLLSDSLFILASFIFVFLWNLTPLNQFTIPLIGILAFIYLLTSTKLLKKITTTYHIQIAISYLNLFVLHTTVLLLVSTTGGTHSSLFFLLYFLSFSISFILQPASVFAFILGSLLLFSNPLTIQLFSIFLIVPLAYFFGKEIRLRKNEEKKLLQIERDTQTATEKITQDVTTIIQTEGNTLKDNDIDALKDIMTQTKSLESGITNLPADRQGQESRD